MHSGSHLVTGSGPLTGKSVSLVLGTGGARGLAHIGAIRALENAGATIKAVAGTSMGALVGGFFAAGQLDTYEEWICSLDKAGVLSYVDWTSTGGLIKGRKVFDKLRELVGDTDIEDLAIDFTAVAVDLDEGREIWLSQGSLFDAIRSSIAIPGLFTPHRLGGRSLVDGGILNPVPVAPTLRTMTDMTIVIDVNGPPTHPSPLASEPDESSDGVMGKLREFMSGLRGDRDPEETQPGMLGVMLRALDIMESALTRHHLAIFRPDLVITLPKNTCMVHEFHRGRQVIELGEERTREALASTDFPPASRAPYNK